MKTVASVGLRPCVIFGTRFESIAMASRALSIPHTTLTRYITSGREGYSLEDPATIVPKGCARHGEPPHVITPEGAFHSLEEAGRAMGIPSATIYSRIRSSSFPEYQYKL